MWALIVSIFSLVVAASSASWNVAQFLLAGARPRAQFVVGAITGNGTGLVTWPVEGDGVEQVRRLAAQGMAPQPVVGVKVINYGRSPVRVERWGIIDDGSGTTYTPIKDSIGPDLPHDLPAGASATWVVDMIVIKNSLETTAEVLGKPLRSIRGSVETGTGKKLVSQEWMPAGVEAT